MERDLWKTSSRDLVQYAAALVGPDEAEDVVSTVFLRIMERQGLEALRDPRPYLFRSVLNECRTRARKQKRQVSLSVINPQLIAPEPLHEVVEAVMRLPLRQRAVTFLVYWMGFTIDESAVLMGLRPGTVKRYLHLARRSLMRQLGSHVREGASYAD